MQSLSEEDLVDVYDQFLSDEDDPLQGEVPRGVFTLGPDDFLNELHRRQQDRQTAAVVNLTNQVRWMTAVIVVCTVIVMILTILLYLKE